ncbi:cupin domain-containing protein [Haloarchaeobius sp. HRN-SO-5]|uniref:cupin domain-containing protein n=1 Tax=Haloarchaeobius sp. HRN-SO-5 TaxID=3446118 RepID=UPI003EBC811F
MEYHHIEVDAVPVTPDRPSDQRSLGDAADLSNVAINRYEVAPGEQVPFVYHYHDEQEEVFYVLDGALHVETPTEEYVVESDHAFVAEPGSPHRAYNPADADGPVSLLAVGAPAVEDAHEYHPDDE